MELSEEVLAELRRLRTDTLAERPIDSPWTSKSHYARDAEIRRAYERLKSYAEPHVIPLLDALDAADAKQEELRTLVANWRDYARQLEFMDESLHDYVRGMANGEIDTLRDCARRLESAIGIIP